MLQILSILCYTIIQIDFHLNRFILSEDILIFNSEEIWQRRISIARPEHIKTERVISFIYSSTSEIKQKRFFYLQEDLENSIEAQLGCHLLKFIIKGSELEHDL